MNLVEKVARVIGSECRNGWQFNDCSKERDCWCRNDLAPAAIDIVLEEAAKVATERFNADNSTAYDKRQCGLPDHYWCGGASAASNIAAAIRALGEK